MSPVSKVIVPKYFLKDIHLQLAHRGYGGYESDPAVSVDGDDGDGDDDDDGDDGGYDYAPAAWVMRLINRIFIIHHRMLQ